MLDTIEDKYSIINGQWIWNTDNPKYHNKNGSVNWDKLLDLSDTTVLHNRGEYLIEHIDKHSNLSFNDIVNLPSGGKFVIPYCPGSGKTSAIRQYMAKIGVLQYTLYATKLIKDVDKFYYDVIAHYYYSSKGRMPPTNTVNKYTSNHPLSIEECQNTHVLITTHERLYKDPPPVIYLTNPDYYASSNESNYRSSIFIDEYIKSYEKKTIDLTKYGAILGNFNYLSLSQYTNNSRTRNSARAFVIEKFLTGCISDIPMSDVSLFSIASIIYTSLSLNLKNDPDFNFKYDIHNKKSVLKSAYFLNIMCELLSEMNELPKTLSYKYVLPNNVNNIYIFDGTGDINFRTSSKIKVIEVPNEFKRSLQLSEPPKIMDNTTVTRLITNEDQIINLITELDKFVDSIKSILNNNDGKLLIYTWKSIKISEELSNKLFNDESSLINFQIKSSIEDLPNYLLSKLSNYQDRVRFITYQSGKERVTSDFTDCNMLYILGKFMIPNSVISDFNEINDAKLQVKEFTISLIIQAIYRTTARKDNPIKLFFSDDYNTKFIGSLLEYIDNLRIINNSSEYLKNKLLSKLVYNNRTKKYYDFIVSNIDKIITNNDLIVPSYERSDKFKNGISNYINKNYYDLLKFKDTTIFRSSNTVNTFRIILK